ncbi:hypothetical protein ACHAWO_002878 [Cyclotella atomus]|uniref:Uncharacterized protein n=1 Tax=Cyclotella atomus TaxID=382360 RepID=A0ABD3QIL2_9STRA
MNNDKLLLAIACLSIERALTVQWIRYIQRWQVPTSIIVYVTTIQEEPNNCLKDVYNGTHNNLQYTSVSPWVKRLNKTKAHEQGTIRWIDKILKSAGTESDPPKSARAPTISDISGSRRSSWDTISSTKPRLRFP